jgi:hypothetical protein
MPQVLKSIEHFFVTPGLAGGLIGAFLVVSASYFIDVRLRIKEASWGLKILFLFSGGLVGALFHHTKGAEMLYCVMLGAGWPYVVISFKKAAEALNKGKLLRRAGQAALRAAYEELRSKLEETGTEEGVEG